MKNIIFPADAVYHSLTHFEVLDSAIRKQLRDAGFDDTQIDAQLLTPGSKFFSSFGTSPQMIVDKLRMLFPLLFTKANPESDGRIRLSFDCGEYIGNHNIVDEQILTDCEKQTICMDIRNGCPIRTVWMERVIPTRMCQLILAMQDNTGYLCSLFPGELAPPLSCSGNEALDPYWRTHLFIR